MIVLDANILVRAVLGRRVRQLVETYAAKRVRFVAPDAAFTDARKYLPPLLEKCKKPDVDVSAALEYLQSMIEPVEPDLYGIHEDDARRRLHERGEDDWLVLARRGVGVPGLDGRCGFFRHGHCGLDHQARGDISGSASKRA